MAYLPLTPSATQRGRLPRGGVSIAIGLWLIAVLGGFAVLIRYGSTPGPDAERPPAEWPALSAIPRDCGRATLVMFTHPRCPCTRASVAELARLLPRVEGRLAASIVVLRPHDVGADWDETEVWERAAAIPGVRVIRDDDGVEASRFHALTSGMTVVYDARGRRLFSGGITASRGHEGDSFGQRRIVALLTNGIADRDTAPVFGCTLGSHHDHDDR